LKVQGKSFGGKFRARLIVNYTVVQNLRLPDLDKKNVGEYLLGIELLGRIKDELLDWLRQLPSVPPLHGAIG
jgi:hypothetical protein